MMMKADVTPPPPRLVSAGAARVGEAAEAAVLADRRAAAAAQQDRLQLATGPQNAQSECEGPGGGQRRPGSPTGPLLLRHRSQVRQQPAPVGPCFLL